ncbi:MAG: radical SAM protein [Firmicutes bacterium]|nr:radical SAM protein [Bacillota bacterium]
MICNYCEWRCDLGNGKPGICQMYMEKDNRIVEKYPNYYTTYHATHIESLPFFHAYPGSRTLQIGSRGCNFDCHYCSNAYVAKSLPGEVYTFNMTPQRIVDVAKQTGCHNIVFSVNEPTVSFPSFLEIAEEARISEFPIGCMTNGYMTQESTDILSSVCEFINISLKGFSQEFYRKYTGIPDFKPILRNIEKLALTNHIEITTPIIQDINDDKIIEIAKFIASIDRNIPWHVFRLLPEYKMEDKDYPSIQEINKKLEDARGILPYIYFSNFIGSVWVSTHCPSCGQKIIERFNLGGCGGKMVKYSLLEDKKCPYCGAQIEIHGEYTQWNSRDESYGIRNPGC